MKKLFLIITLTFLLSTVFVLPQSTLAAGLVPCDGKDCDINAFFTLLKNVYDFIVLQVATPLAILAIAVGGILVLISAGNPNLSGTGKKILFSAILGLVLVFGSWLIINFVLDMVGFTKDWTKPF